MTTAAAFIDAARGMPTYRDVGWGPNVLCLHGSLGSSGQWRHLVAALAGRHRVIAPDFWGHGRSPGWTAGVPFELDDDVDLLEPLIDRASGPVHLVGHSYGGAVALRVAMLYPERVRSVTVFEPVLFGLLTQDPLGAAAAYEVRALVAALDRDLARRDHDGAGRRFVDYWSGDGAWDALPSERRERMAGGMLQVRAHFAAVLGTRVPLTALATLDMPALLLSGARSPRTTRRIVELLEVALPRVRSHCLDGVGHMGPVTHPERVGSHVERFLASPLLPAVLAA